MRWTTGICAAVLVAFLAAGCAGPSAQAQGDLPGAQVEPPMPPPATPPPPPAYAGGLEVPPPSVADGQWVYTAQYGWVWAPYSDTFVWVPASGTGEPLEFVYYPSYGWTWVAAPWVWGMGPWPYFGRPAPTRFAWYQRGWWREPRRWHYVGTPPRGPIATRGVRPAPPGRPAPVARPAPAPSGQRQGRLEPERRTGRAEPERRPARAEPDRSRARDRGEADRARRAEPREGERERRPE
jgi:hypothetical protein